MIADDDDVMLSNDDECDTSFILFYFFLDLLKLSHRKYYSDSQNLLPANRPALDYDDIHTGRRPQLIYLWGSCIGVLYIPNKCKKRSL